MYDDIIEIREFSEYHRSVSILERSKGESRSWSLCEKNIHTEAKKCDRIYESNFNLVRSEMSDLISEDFIY